jgi:addiction module HigA family antidote
LSTIIELDASEDMAKRLDPIHPGEILQEEFMKPALVSQNRLAREIGVNVARISDIVRGRRGVSADTAVRLAAFWSTTPEFWMNLQSRYDLKLAQRAIGDRGVSAIKPLRAA